MSKFATLRGTSAAGRSYQEIALQAVEAARMPVDIDDFTRSRRKCVVVLASNETGHASATNASMALTNNEDDSYMATQENSSASTNPQETTHTPGPWTIAPNSECSGYGRPSVTPLLIEAMSNEDGLTISLAAVIGDVEELNAQANAEFIVRACNNHNELLDALETALEWLRANDMLRFTCDGGAQLGLVMETAIAKAKGGAR